MSEPFDSEYEEENLDEAQFEEDLEHDEYEEFDEEHDEEVEEDISTAEVDQVLETLTKMMEDVESESVHAFLEEAYHGVFQLVYEEEESDEADGEEASGEEDEFEDDGEDFGPHSEAA